MEVCIREIEKKDYPAVLSLWNDEIGNKWVTAQNIAPHYDRVKNDDNYKTFVAVIENEVVGFVASVQAYAVGFEEQQMQITGIAVKSDKHNTGIGTKLLQFIEKYAQDKGTASIYLCCGVQRTNAHAFYKFAFILIQCWDPLQFVRVHDHINLPYLPIEHIQC